MKRNEFRNLKSVFSPIVESSYMVSLSNSQEFVAVLKKYGKLITRLIFPKSKVSSRLQTLTKFSIHLLKVNKNHGPVFAVKYLKALNVALQRYISGSPLKSLREIEPDLPLPRLTSGGLPNFIPSRDRHEISKSTLSVVRWYLSLFSVYRIISCPGEPKYDTITDPFKGKQDSLDLISTWLLTFSKRFVSIKHKDFDLPPVLGLDKILKASPSAMKSFLGFLVDAESWRGNPVFATFAMYSNNMSLYYDWFRIIKDGITNHKCNAYLGQEMIKGPFLGQLALKSEAAGKKRVFAMVDVWTQSILRPLHDLLFRVFHSLPNDATHNQDKSFKRAQEKAVKANCAYCYDLSAATDRLPIVLQSAILDSLFGHIVPEEDLRSSFGRAWADLLVKREFLYPSSEKREGGVRYSVGQPMGALSSWAMLNLCHHMILQMINYYIFRKVQWYTNYEVLGDDIVIFNHQVASLYHEVMEVHLGVNCNVSKSLIAKDRPVLEFAKRISIGMDEVSAISFRQLRSQDSLAGRAAITVDLLTRRNLPSPMRALRVLNSKQWSTVSSYGYALLNFGSVITKRGAFPLKSLCDFLIDIKNPFRFIGGRIIGNLRFAWLENAILEYIAGKPITMYKEASPRIPFYSRLFAGYSRGYLEDKVLDLYVRLEDKKFKSSCWEEFAKLYDPPLPIDLVQTLFYPGVKSKIPRRKDLDAISIEDLLKLLEDLMQIQRDFQFYKVRVNRSKKLDNPLNLISFVEKSKKKGLLSIEINRL